MGYRTISRPLLEAIHQAQLRVNVELLRPGTFEALSQHLEGKDDYYHIVHFDAHGELMTHEDYQRGVTNDRYTYQRRYGRSDMKPYDGVKAFLFLEGERKGEVDPVEAEELVALLTGKEIPICILNACQSGKQVKGESGAGGPTPGPSQAGNDVQEGDAADQNPKYEQAQQHFLQDLTIYVEFEVDPNIWATLGDL